MLAGQSTPVNVSELINVFMTAFDSFTSPLFSLPVEGRLRGVPKRDLRKQPPRERTDSARVICGAEITLAPRRIYENLQRPPSRERGHAGGRSPGKKKRKKETKCMTATCFRDRFGTWARISPFWFLFGVNPVRGDFGVCGGKVSVGNAGILVLVRL